MKNLLFLALTFLLCSCRDNPKYIGRWSLHIIEYFDEETQSWTESEWMKNGTGLLDYAEGGYMTVHFTPEDYCYPPVGTNDTLLLDDSLLQLSVLSSDYWYVGNYELTEDGHMLHHRIMHSYPEDWGVTVKRKLDFIGDTLVLTSTERAVNLRLKWTRYQFAD